MKYELSDKSFDELALFHFASYMARAKVLSECVVESCIISTRVAGEVLRALDVRVLPLVVSVNIFNRAARAAIESGRDPADDPQSFGLGIRYRPNEDGDANDNARHIFHGHVALIANGHYLIDSSIDQATRATRGIVIPPLTMELEDFDAFLSGAKSTVGLENGPLLIYEAHIEDTSYQRAPDWTEPVDDLDLLTEGVLGLIEVALEVGELPPLPALPTATSANAWEGIKRARAAGASEDEVREVLNHAGFDYDAVIETIGSHYAPSRRKPIRPARRLSR